MDNWLVFVIFLVIIPLVIYFGIMQQRRVNATWKQVASRLGLRYTPAAFRSASRRTRSSRRIQGTLKGNWVRVDTHTTGRENKTTWTRYRVCYPQPLGLGLNLTRQGFFSGVTQFFFDSQDLEIGDASFDNAVVVKGADAKRIAEFLTPSRRLRIHRLLSGKHDCVVDDRGLGWSVPGLESNASTLVSNIQLGISVAQHLESARQDDQSIDKAIQAQADGRLDEALEIVRNAPREEDEIDADAQVLEGEILYTGGHYQEAADAFNKAVEEGHDDDEMQQWAERATARAESSPLPQAQTASLDMKAVCEELFGASMMTFDTNRVFEDKYQGTTSTWSGILKRADRCSYDMVFGSEPCTKAVFETHELAGGIYGAKQVQAVVQLPLDVLDDLRSRVGEEVSFEGTLTSCDAFMRNLFLKDGQLETDA